MKPSTLQNQESDDGRLIEDISQISCVALGAGAATCHVCGDSLREGERVTAFAFRGAGSPMVEVGYVLCGDDWCEWPGVYTLGVRELVVGGRVGRCVDVAVQSSWLVLLAPVVLAVSAMDSKDARVVRTVGDFDDQDCACVTDDAMVAGATVDECRTEDRTPLAARSSMFADTSRSGRPGDASRVSSSGGDDDGK